MFWSKFYFLNSWNPDLVPWIISERECGVPNDEFTIMTQQACSPLSATDVGEAAMKKRHVMNQTRRAIYCRNLWEMPKSFPSETKRQFKIHILVQCQLVDQSRLGASSFFFHRRENWLGNHGKKCILTKIRFPVIAHRIYCYDCYDFRLFSSKWCNDLKAHLKHHSICDSIENFSLDSSSPQFTVFSWFINFSNNRSFKFTYSAVFVYIGDDEKMKCAKGKNERTNLVKLQVIQSNDE